MYPDWLHECSSLSTYVDETPFKAEVSVSERSASARQSVPTSGALMYRPSTDSSSSQASKSTATIARRRSDASSMPLRPDGVFRETQISLFGWSDLRQESALSYQITSNGGTIVPLTERNQYACVCADGSRPTTADVCLVSQRWINECLATGELVEPSSRTIFKPSLGQLPLLLATKLCVYITEKDQAKYDEIAELAKLCGIRFVSRSESRTPVSAVTHFIFHDLVSINRRRDLVPVARKNGKHIVSFDWLKDTYLMGSRQEESKYDLATALEAPALPPPTLPSPDDSASLLAGLAVSVCANLDEDVCDLASAMGAHAIIENRHQHVCRTGGIRIAATAACACETVSESWLRECDTQKRLVPRQTYLVREEEGLDLLMAQKDLPRDVKWENRKAKTLAKQVSL